MLKRINDVLAGLPMTIIGGVLLVFSFVLPRVDVSLPVDPAWGTVVISGIPLLYLAVWRIIYNPGISKISSALLITIAMFAAIAIGDLFAAGEVAFIMAIGALLEDATTNRAKKGLKKLISLAPTQGRRIRNGKEEMISAEKIMKGDMLRILPGETVPVDGVIVVLEERISDFVGYKPPRELPVVLICESAADHCPTVDADQYGCSTAIVDYLMSKGHKTVYHIAGPSTSRAAESRARGWREALEQMGARVPSMYIGDWCADSGYQAGVALAHDPDCTAIYAANDQMAYGAMLGLQSVGKRVPEDVSIVGVDDSLVDMVPRLNLTTMKLRFDDIGATAFSMVRRQCEGEKIPVGVKTVIPPELIERGSVLDIS